MMKAAWHVAPMLSHRDEVIGALPVLGVCVHGECVQLQDGALREQVGPDLHVLHGAPEQDGQHGPQPDGLLVWHAKLWSACLPSYTQLRKITACTFRSELCTTKWTGAMWTRVVQMIEAQAGTRGSAELPTLMTHWR